MTPKVRLLLALLVLLSACGIAFWRLVDAPAPGPAVLSPGGAAVDAHDGPAAVLARVEVTDRAGKALLAEPSARDVAPRVESSGAFGLQGRVRDKFGETFAYASVHVREVRASEQVIDGRGPFVNLAVSNEEGEFDLRVDRRGEFVLWAVASGYGVSPPARVRLEPREPTAEVELTLGGPLREIVGVVLDVDRRPVVGAQVSAYVDVEDAGIELPGGATGEELYGALHAVSAADGSFWLSPWANDAVPYVVRAEKARAGDREVETPTGPGLRRVLELWRAEVKGARAGAAPLSLVLRPPPAVTASVRLELATSGGGALPEAISCRLRHIGPNGGTYRERPWRGPLDAEGLATIPDLDPGARYEIVLEEKTSEAGTTLGPFIARVPEVRLQATVAGLFDVVFRIEDPARRARSLAILHIDESGRRRSMLRRGVTSADEEFHLQLPAGQFLAELSRKTKGRDGELGFLETRTFEMPNHQATFTITVP